LSSRGYSPLKRDKKEAVSAQRKGEKIDGALPCDSRDFSPAINASFEASQRLSLVSGDLFVVARKLTGSLPFSIAAAVTALITFLTAWFGVTA
jgi:hypothetical protein